MRVRDENEFPPEWADDQYNVQVFFSKRHKDATTKLRKIQREK